MPKKAEDAYGGSRELSCLALQVFPGPRTQNNEVRGFFIAFREGRKGGRKEPKKNLTI